MAIFKRLLNGSKSPTYFLKFRHEGKQILLNTHTADKSIAERFEREQRRLKSEGRAAEALAALQVLRTRRLYASIGDVCAAYLDESVKLIDSDKERRRNAADLRAVVAWANDLWTTHKGGIRGVKIGADIPDLDRIDKLSSGILTGKLVKDYFRARQGGVLDVTSESEGNTSINSTLKHARSVFSSRSMSYKLGELALPDLSSFLKEPFLREGDSEPEPIKETEFAAMLGAWSLLPADDELRLVNLLLRQTGMRSGSVIALERDWLEDLRSGPVLHVRVRKGGTALYSVPVTEDLASIIRARPAGPVLRGTEAQRKELVTTKHNAWLKAIIGGAGERAQGNHRLRDTVATVLLSWLGIGAAKLALGHADEKVTLKHYGRLRLDVSAEMKHELRAFERDNNVVAFKAVS